MESFQSVNYTGTDNQAYNCVKTHNNLNIRKLGRSSPVSARVYITWYTAILATFIYIVLNTILPTITVQKPVFLINHLAGTSKTKYSYNQVTTEKG